MSRSSVSVTFKQSDLHRAELHASKYCSKFTLKERILFECHRDEMRIQRRKFIGTRFIYNSIKQVSKNSHVYSNSLNHSTQLNFLENNEDDYM